MHFNLSEQHLSLRGTCSIDRLSSMIVSFVSLFFCGFVRFTSIFLSYMIAGFRFLICYRAGGVVRDENLVSNDSMRARDLFLESPENFSGSKSQLTECNLLFLKS